MNDLFFISSTLKTFLRGKVRHKIADCLESGYALTYCQLVKACMRDVALQTPRAEQNATDWYKKLERIRQIVLKSEGKILE